MNVKDRWGVAGMGDKHDLDLPPGIAATWGIEQRSGRGPKRGMTLDEIVAAGIRVARAGGIQAVSMSRVAAELGTSAMSLYRYVGSKNELLILMTDAAGSDTPAIQETGDWRASMTVWAVANLELFREHPWILRVPIPGAPVTPNQVRWMEAGLTALRETNLTGVERISTILLVNGFARTFALMEADILDTVTTARDLSRVSMASYGDVIGSLVNEEQFPEVTALHRSGVFDATDDLEDEFQFGLDRILDGIESLIIGRTASP